ncbi:MAG: M28 family metallopeptidase [Wenzhouxiangellaceae bacterium]
MISCNITWNTNMHHFLARLMFLALLLSSAAAPADDDSSVFAFSAADLAIATQLREQALQSDLAYAITADLTTRVGARAAGTPQDALAVQWAVNQLKTLGFDRVWTQPVTFPYWHRGEESAQLLTPGPQDLTIMALGGSPATPAQGLVAEMIMFEDLEALQAVPDNSLEGRIAFINKRMERHQDGHGYGQTVPGRSSGPAVAKAKGASALLIRSVGTDHDRIAHTGTTRIPEDGSGIVPAAAVSNPDADQIERLFKLGMSPQVMLNLQTGFDGEATSYNVFGEVTGTAADDFIVLGAHLDSWDAGTGAVDDGAGVGIVTAAAKLIMDLDTRPKRGLRVALFANEEQGLYGGYAYLQHLQQQNPAMPLQHQVMALESDLGAGRIYRIDARVNPAGWDVISAMHALLAPLGIELGSNGKPGGSDIFPMINAGVANIALRQDASEYFDLHHTDNDTLDKIDPAALQQNLAAWVVTTWLVAQSGVDFGSGTLSSDDG